MKNRVFGIYGRVFEKRAMHTGYVIDTPHFSFSHNIRGDSFFVLLGGMILGGVKKILGGV
jgi:hypothetical protein